MQIKIKIFTPIWTGDVNRDCTKLRETSIIGSLRWWFETIVRGWGGYACDPHLNKCEYNGNEKDICAVCKLFGTTNWAKRFKFEINQSFNEIYGNNLVIGGESKNWYYPSGLVSCNGSANKIEQILPCHIDEEKVKIKPILKVLLKFISKWGMIGGKSAIGYGVVRFENEKGGLLVVSDDDVKMFFNYLEQKKNHEKNGINVPKLNEIFFAKFKVEERYVEKILDKIGNNTKQFPNKILKCNGIEKDITNPRDFLVRLKDCYGFTPSSALVRKELRNRIRNKWLNNDKLRHFLMGELGNFSAVQISHIYWNGKNWEFRIWGWIPKNLNEILGNSDKKSDTTRDNIMTFIKNTLSDSEFWENALGCSISEIIEYPNNGWNFIDLGGVGDVEKVKDAFKEMVMKND